MAAASQQQPAICLAEPSHTCPVIRTAPSGQDDQNNTIRVIQRRAYGYRDAEYLRLKILTAFLPRK